MPESTRSSIPTDHLWVTILAGGVGSRFWPVSTPERPKQLLPLAGEAPLIAETVRRARGLVPDDRIRILTGRHLVDPIRGALPDLPEESFLVEPEARGTAPALAWAAWSIQRSDPEAVLLSLHSDHVVEPEEEFLGSLTRAAHLAREEDLLVTVAIDPTRPETGYGYIRTGSPLGSADPETASADPARGWRVDAFVEKPDRETATRYVEEGYLWNSGIFAWSARRFLEEVRRRAPEIGRLLIHLDRGKVEEYFLRAPTISVDEAVLERSDRVATVAASFRWDDVGSWEALGRTRPPGAAGNVSVGESFLVESRDNIVFADDAPVVLFGVEDLVVVRTRGVTLVTSREHAPRLKELLERLPPSLRNPEV